MKNVLCFLKKLDNTLTHSLLMCCAGLGFIILTERLLDTVMLVIGATIAFIAVCLIAAWIFDSEREDMPRIFRHGSIIKASLLLAFGVAIMIVRSAVSVLCVPFSAYFSRFTRSSSSRAPAA